jgi:hypothetical protein
MEKEHENNDIALPPEEPSETDKLLLEKGFSVEDLLGLGDEEKAGLLLKDEDVPGDGEPLPPEDGDKPPVETPPPAAKTEEPPVVVPPPVDAPPVETPPPAAPVPDDQLLSFKPVVLDSEITVPETIPDVFQQELNKLVQQYDDGDIERGEYETKRDAINRKVYRNEERLRAEARDTVAWNKEQSFFFANRQEYREKSIKGDALFGALNKRVEELSSDPKNAHLSGMQLLVMADREVKGAFGIPLSGTKAQPAKSFEDALKPLEPKPDIVTLADIPSAGKNQVGDPFSELDSLKGEAYEEALERLPQSVRDAYLSRV